MWPPSCAAATSTWTRTAAGSAPGGRHDGRRPELGRDARLGGEAAAPGGARRRRRAPAWGLDVRDAPAGHPRAGRAPFAGAPVLRQAVLRPARRRAADTRGERPAAARSHRCPRRPARGRRRHGRALDHPSLLMTLLPGTVRLTDEGSDRRAELLARQLLGIHRVRVSEETRPRTYEAWTGSERVTVPPATGRPELWRRAVDVIRRDPPGCRPRFLHRDFHPGNVLFDGAGDDQRVSGVVDWVETSWGPADLDVAHCSTALALLHGVPAGMSFADRYTEAGGSLAEDRAAHLYWRLLDALAFAPDAEKVAVPWRESGRTDLTPTVLAGRLEAYVEALLDRYA
ncbi:aminoglycoside phosphotransferase family protein [Streptomyces niveus]|uniref:aminoglycoside phosphotransferase family protein n=1 Tax=Streptomyces niveus TaxID=193462 RepID=UPI00342532FA